MDPDKPGRSQGERSEARPTRALAAGVDGGAVVQISERDEILVTNVGAKAFDVGEARVAAPGDEREVLASGRSDGVRIPVAVLREPCKSQVPVVSKAARDSQCDTSRFSDHRPMLGADLLDARCPPIL